LYFEEFVPNSLVSKDKYYAIDRGGDKIIIDATNNNALKTVQIKVTLEQFHFNAYWR